MSVRGLRLRGYFFLAGGVLVGSYDGCVEHEPFEVGFLQSLENGLPTALFGPSGEAFVDSVVVAIALGQVGPGRAGARDPEDRIDEASVIVGVSTGHAGLSREQGFDPGVVVVGDFVASLFGVGHGLGVEGTGL